MAVASKLLPVRVIAVPGGPEDGEIEVSMGVPGIARLLYCGPSAPELLRPNTTIVPEVNAEHRICTSEYPAMLELKTPAAVAEDTQFSPFTHELQAVMVVGESIARVTQFVPSTVPSSTTVPTNVPDICQDTEATFPCVEPTGSSTHFVELHAESPAVASAAVSDPEAVCPAPVK
jgi:hypothetical protein